MKILKSGGEKILLKLFRDQSGYSRKLLSLLSKIWPHPVLKFLARVFHEISPLCRERGVKNVLLNSPKISSTSLPPLIFIALTNRCNLRCPGCGIRQDRPQDLAWDTADSIIREAIKEGTNSFFLAGGEPLLWPGLQKLIEKHEDVYFEIVTNGTRMDRSWADFLATRGNASVFFSLEGFEQETDARRGKGVFSMVLQAMFWLRKQGIPFGLNILVTPGNFETATSDAFIRYMIRQGIIATHYFAYKPIGNNPDMTLMLSLSQRILLYERILNIRKKYPLLALDHEKDISSLGGCVATKGLGIFINHEGRLEPCGGIHYSDAILGNGRSLKDVYYQSPFLRRIRTLDPPHAGCLLTDRPQDLLRIVQHSFPLNAAEFPDLVALREYAKICPAHSFSKSPKIKKDLYARIGKFLFTSYLKRTRTGIEDLNHCPPPETMV